MAQQTQTQGIGFPARPVIPAALDRELALSRVGGDVELLKEIAQLFLDDAARMLAEIRTAVEARDPDAIDRAAHTLKGCVSNFGALRLYESALSLEQMGRKRELGHVETGFRVLEMEIHRLEADLLAFTAERPAVK